MPSGQNDNDSKGLNGLDFTLHYALSQNDHFRLKTISDAMLGVAALAQRQPSESDPEICSDHLSSIFRAFAGGLDNVLAAAPLSRCSTARKAA